MIQMEEELAIMFDQKLPNSSSKRLMNKVAVITGAARGIGAATAKLFANNGAYVVVADILDEQGAAIADSIGGRFIHCDVSKETDIESAVNLALCWKGRLDIMFNNAAISGPPDGSITNIDTNQLKHLLAINVEGVVLGIKHAARAMLNNNDDGGHEIGGRGGSIICTSSSAAIMGGLGGHAYTLSKEAIVGVARSTACELGVHGIRVNCISPHGVPSDMLVRGMRKFLRKDVTEEEVKKIVGETGSLLRGRSGREEDVAEAALFLASEEAAFITAHNLVVDGGFTSACSSLSFIYQ